MIKKLDSDKIQVSLKVDKGNYRAGDLIKGVIYLKVKSSDLDCSMIFIKLIGVQKVNQIDKQTQCLRFKNIFYKKHKWLYNFGSHLKQGIYKRQFELETPQEIPSFCINFNKTVQCRMIYILSIYFTDENQQTIYKIEPSHKIIINVHHIPQISEMQPICYVGEQKELKKLCFINGGVQYFIFNRVQSATISLQINKQGFLIGESIDIDIEIDNTKTDLNLLNLNFSILSQLIILYPQLKLKISNYFSLVQSVQNINVKGRQKRQLEFKLKLEQDKNDPQSIYPQSTLFTDRIIHHYYLCLIANYSQKFQNCNQLTIVIPINIFQTELRQQQQQQNDANLTSNKQKVMFSDHNINGYGLLDGCSEQFKYNEESLQDEELKLQNISNLKPFVDDDELENEYEVFCTTQQQQFNILNGQDNISDGNILKKGIGYNENLDIIQEENDDRCNHSVKQSIDKECQIQTDQINNNNTIFQ